ncbi:MAG: hypothetical protein AB7O52_19480, partial [Planctomycetota bacterium]
HFRRYTPVLSRPIADALEHHRTRLPDLTDTSLRARAQAHEVNHPLESPGSYIVRRVGMCRETGLQVGA